MALPKINSLTAGRSVFPFMVMPTAAERRFVAPRSLKKVNKWFDPPQVAGGPKPCHIYSTCSWNTVLAVDDSRRGIQYPYTGQKKEKTRTNFYIHRGYKPADGITEKDRYQRA